MELQEHLKYVPKKLGLSKEEFEKIMCKPPRKHEEFSFKFPKVIHQIDRNYLIYFQ